jgi:hypothetical protein
MSDLSAEVRALVAAVYAAAGAEPPALDDARLRAALTAEGLTTDATDLAEEQTPVPGAAPLEDQTALAGADGREAARLLGRAQRQGAELLHRLTAAAVGRIIAGHGHGQRLFSDQERRQLALALAAVTATAELLGRARIRRRQEQAERHDAAFTEETPTDFCCFDEGSGGIQPLAPRAAVAWFRRLVPRLRLATAPFARRHERGAFTLAVATERTLLDRVKAAIAETLEQGRLQGAQRLQVLLDAAGVAPRNPQYAEMVFRTNAMRAYTEGADAELRDPEVVGTFPVWRYLGIADGRQGKDHEPHFGRYYSKNQRFGDVRGQRIFNCRCNFQPLTRHQWERLQKAGAVLSQPG